MSEKLWIKDPTVLYARPLDFIPSSAMGLTERLNALVRFSIYLFIMLIFFHRRSEYIWIIMLALVFSLVYHDLVMNREVEQMENETPAEHYDNHRGFVKTGSMSDVNRILNEILPDYNKGFNSKNLKVNDITINKRVGKIGHNEQLADDSVKVMRNYFENPIYMRSNGERGSKFIEEANNQYIKLGLSNRIGGKRWAAPQWEQLQSTGNYNGRDITKYNWSNVA